ncbi:hypothetical protein H4R20_001457 [Coemansia guatemalensis]|uniref:Plasma membrane ATPase n=1 Tax=Coemansia guatemalensis TaxID=2761395 RepID=A0A9W8HZ59_9FUNG|nr:hypothetical protein H4R20_001457 [Coemansia guatemalensis]
MATLSVDPGMLAVSDLYDKEKFDLNTMDNKLVFHLLQTSPEGLSQTEATARIKKFGYNEPPEKSTNLVPMFLSFIRSPLPCAMIVAAIVSIALNSNQKAFSGWLGFVGIISLLLGNFYVGYYEDRNSRKSVETLMEIFALQCKVKRDGKWETMKARYLVPGDIIAICNGDVVPADSRVIVSNNVKVYQDKITGESLPVGKDAGDEVFLGSMVRQGEAEAIVIGTGSNTFIGRAALLVAGTDKDMSHLQQILAKISNFCTCSTAIILIAEIIAMLSGYHDKYGLGINNIFVLFIGGIPIAISTALSAMLAIGAKQLAKHKVIVTRNSAIEELASVTILCSDKTGTLTQNKLAVKKESIKQYADVSSDNILLYASYASRVENQDAIDKSVVDSLPTVNMARDGIDELAYIPVNPVDMRTQMTYRRHSDGTVHRATKGMVNIILKLCTKNMTPELENKVRGDVKEFSERGLRALIVAEEDVPSGEPEGEGSGFRLIGMLPIFDPPLHDAKETIERATDLGVHVKMISGDQLAIAKETGRELGMGDTMYKASVLSKADELQGIANSVDELVLRADGFAGVYPEHKYEIIERLQKMGHMVAMMGDGANDAAALEKANVGIAVANASDTTRSAADIILSEVGLSALIEAFKISRIVFQRMRCCLIYTFAVVISLGTIFSILAFAFNFDLRSSMMILLAIIINSTMLTISTDRVKPSRHPNVWNLAEIVLFAIVYGCYLALSTLIFFIVVNKSSFFQRYGCMSFTDHNDFSFQSVIYLQILILSQALIFVTRAHGFFFAERPSTLLMCTFAVAQFVLTIITIYSSGWHWAGAVWIWDIFWFMPLDFIKLKVAATIQHFAIHNSPPTPGASVKQI